ncbi:hypothetical protein FF38_03547 [Lucilia cuprina]|uniref:Uncharacterized protein n=1 Tax=Lucilia cuprina TaxID=7375 RepID=A0A0L0C5F4_LUCCU|nr:hypothetical protein FF38_03547 [Lucilia cuprina]
MRCSIQYILESSVKILVVYSLELTHCKLENFRIGWCHTHHQLHFRRNTFELLNCECVCVREKAGEYVCEFKLCEQKTFYFCRKYPRKTQLGTYKTVATTYMLSPNMFLGAVSESSELNTLLEDGNTSVQLMTIKLQLINTTFPYPLHKTNSAIPPGDNYVLHDTFLYVYCQDDYLRKKGGGLAVERVAHPE